MIDIKEDERTRIQRYREEIRGDIIKFLYDNSPTTLNAIRIAVGIPWVTTKKYLRDLEAEGFVKETKAGHIRIFSIVESPDQKEGEMNE